MAVAFPEMMSWNIYFFCLKFYIYFLIIPISTIFLSVLKYKKTLIYHEFTTIERALI